MLLTFFLLIFIIATNSYILISKLLRKSYLKIDCSDIKSKDDLFDKNHIDFNKRLSSQIMKIYVPLILLNIILFLATHALNYIFYGSTISIEEDSLTPENSNLLGNLILISFIIYGSLSVINLIYMNVQIKKAYIEKSEYIFGLWHDLKVIFIYWFIFFMNSISITAYFFYYM